MGVPGWSSRAGAEGTDKGETRGGLAGSRSWEQASVGWSPGERDEEAGGALGAREGQVMEF